MMFGFFRRARGLSIAVALAALAALMTGGLAARAAGELVPAAYLPAVSAGGNAPPVGSLPAPLVGTWYHGKILNREFYDRQTQTWQDPGGLAHMYILGADGSYVLASYLEFNSGLGCLSRVWKYQVGAARAEGGNLLLTPTTARTRTKIDCGSHTDTETQGPYTTAAVPYQLIEDEKGHTKLLLSEAQGVTDYFRDGIAAQVAGSWRRGELVSAGFYDPATGAWGEPSGVGEWYQFSAGGTFRYGGLITSFSPQGCKLWTQIYQEGKLTGSGSTITTKSTAGARRVFDECAGDVVADEAWVDPTLGEFAWSLTNRDTEPTLQLLRLLPFEQRQFLPDE